MRVGSSPRSPGTSAREEKLPTPASSANVSKQSCCGSATSVQRGKRGATAARYLCRQHAPHIIQEALERVSCGQ